MTISSENVTNIYLTVQSPYISHLSGNVYNFSRIYIIRKAKVLPRHEFLGGLRSRFLASHQKDLSEGRGWQAKQRFTENEVHSGKAEWQSCEEAQGPVYIVELGFIGMC